VSTQAVRPPTLLPLVLALGGFIVAFHVGNALVGKSFIRATHLGTALEYAHAQSICSAPSSSGLMRQELLSPRSFRFGKPWLV